LQAIVECTRESEGNRQGGSEDGPKVEKHLELLNISIVMTDGWGNDVNGKRSVSADVRLLEERLTSCMISSDALT
jgi:hypothetical protein